MFLLSTKARVTRVIEEYFGKTALSEAIAERVEKSLYEQVTLHAVMKDNTKVEIRVQDKGDLVPGFTADGCRFEAFTLYWCIWFGKDKPPLEEYIQMPRATIEAHGDKAKLFHEALFHALIKAGVRTASVSYQGESLFPADVARAA